MTSRATRARRATTSRAESEAGFTLVELAVTMLVMGLVATAVMSIAMRTFTVTQTVTNRRDVFADGRFSLDMLSKQLRQGVSVDSASTSTAITFSTYVGGTLTTVKWRVTGSAAPYSLQESLNGGSSYATTASSLTTSDVFTYTTHGGVTDEVTVSLSLGTDTATVPISTDVQLRNADEDS